MPGVPVATTGQWIDAADGLPRWQSPDGRVYYYYADSGRFQLPGRPNPQTPQQVGFVAGEGEVYAPSKDLSDQTGILSDQWDYYRYTYGDMEDQALKEAGTKPPVDLWKKQADQAVAQEATKREGLLTRALAKRGEDWGSGKYAEMRKELAADDALTQVAARNKLQATGRDMPVQQMNQMMKIGQNIPAQTLSSLGQSAALEAQLAQQKASGLGNLMTLGAVGAGSLGGLLKKDPTTGVSQLGSSWNALKTGTSGLLSSVKGWF